MEQDIMLSDVITLPLALVVALVSFSIILYSILESKHNKRSGMKEKNMEENKLSTNTSNVRFIPNKWALKKIFKGKFNEKITVEDIKTQIFNEFEENTQLQKKVHSLEDKLYEIDEWKDKYDASQIISEKYKDRIEVKEDEIKSYKKDINSLQNEIKKLKSKITDKDLKIKSIEKQYSADKKDMEYDFKKQLDDCVKKYEKEIKDLKAKYEKKVKKGDK